MMFPRHAYRPGDPQNPLVVDLLAEEAARPQEDDHLHCILCGEAITRERSRVERAGSHSHTRMNPAGLLFSLGCFADAPGCLAVGDDYREYSWFAGYTWTVVVCRSCHAHMGWLFRAESDSFHGLILDRLRAGQRP